MATRYAYWRTPTGAAYRGTDSKYAPRQVLAEVGKAGFINQEGNVGWRGFEWMRLNPVVVGSIAVLDSDGEELAQSDAGGIVSAALSRLVRATGGRSPIAAEALMREADKEAAIFLRKKPENYVLVTCLSVESLPVRQVRSGHCLIERLQSRDRYPVPAVAHRAFPETLSGRSARPVRVRTCGRSIAEAADRALDALALACGLWNLFSTYGGWSIELGKSRSRPLGPFRVGPVHTLHTPDGPSIENLCWYEPDYAELNARFAQEEWDVIEKQRRWAMTRLRHLPYKREVRLLLARYAAALSRSDPDLSSLQLWGLLESITGTIGANYDETIQRASWPWVDGILARELLAYLRQYRNRYVHVARSDENRDQVVQLTKSFVEAHLVCLLRNDFRVNDLNEYASCLSLPTSVGVLKRRRTLIGGALRFRRV